MVYGSEQQDYGLAPLEGIRDQMIAAETRTQDRVKHGLGPAAIDLAITNGQITPGGAVLMSGRVRPIRLRRTDKDSLSLGDTNEGSNG